MPDAAEPFDYPAWCRSFWDAVIADAAEAERATRAAADARLRDLASPSAAVH